jgi:hypothetical protein
MQKEAIIAGVIKRAKEDNVTIKLPADYYVEELDKLIQKYVETENEEALGSPLGLTFHTIAAMEGDWDNGDDPLEHAQKLMGDKLFKSFKKMYPEKYKKLEEKSRLKTNKQGDN